MTENEGPNIDLVWYRYVGKIRHLGRITKDSGSRYKSPAFSFEQGTCISQKSRKFGADPCSNTFRVLAKKRWGWGHNPPESDGLRIIPIYLYMYFMYFMFGIISIHLNFYVLYVQDCIHVSVLYIYILYVQDYIHATVYLYTLCVGLYPWTSLMSHACIPNVKIITRQVNLIFFAKSFFKNIMYFVHQLCSVNI